MKEFIVNNSFDKVDIDIDDYDIKVRFGEEFKMLYSEVREGFIQVTCENEALCVRSLEDSRPFIGRKGKKMDITLPSNPVLLRVKVDNGKIDCGNGSIAGNAEFSADNGTIKLFDIEAQVIEAETDNGIISVESAKSKVLTAKTDNGPIRVVNSRAADRMDLNANNGMIRVIDSETVRLSAVTDNGPIRIRAAADSIKAKTDNGGITADIKGEENAYSLILKNNLKNFNKEGSNPDCNLDLETGNGSVKLRFYK